MDKVLKKIDSIILMMFGLFMIKIVMSGELEYFLHPRFYFLTLTSGTVMFLLGSFVYFVPCVRTSIVKTSVLLAMLGLCLFGVFDFFQPEQLMRVVF